VAIALSNNSMSGRRGLVWPGIGQYAQSRSVLLPQVKATLARLFDDNLKGLGIDIPACRRTTDPFGSLDARITLRQTVEYREPGSMEEFRRQTGIVPSVVGECARDRGMNVVAVYLQALRIKASRDALAEQTRLADDLYKLTQDR